MDQRRAGRKVIEHVAIQNIAMHQPHRAGQVNAFVIIGEDEAGSGGPQDPRRRGDKNAEAPFCFRRFRNRIMLTEPRGLNRLAKSTITEPLPDGRGSVRARPFPSRARQRVVLQVFQHL